MVKLGMVVQDLKISIDILRLSNIPRKPIYCSSCWICSHPRHILLVVVQIATLCPHVLHRLKHCPRASDRWAETSKNRPLSLPTETTSSHNNYPSPYWKKSGKHGRSTATVVHRATRFIPWALGIWPDNAARVTGSPLTARWNLPDLSRSSTPPGGEWGQLTDLSMFKDASSVSL
jgi:hypothetical protein